MEPDRNCLIPVYSFAKDSFKIVEVRFYSALNAGQTQ
jgi:hypothetical protein